MLISTRGRYALRVMLDLAQQDGNQFTVLSEIAARQQISEKYLESILSILSRAHLVQSLRGRGGGYRLAVDPAQCTVGSILKLTDGSLAPVACLTGRTSCAREQSCLTHPLWSNLHKLIEDYFENITLADLLCAQVVSHEGLAPESTSAQAEIEAILDNPALLL